MCIRFVKDFSMFLGRSSDQASLKGIRRFRSRAEQGTAYRIVTGTALALAA
jgi:hypothetical protein